MAGTSQEEEASTAGLLTRNKGTAAAPDPTAHPFLSRNERGEEGEIWPIKPSLPLEDLAVFPLAL